MANIKTWKDQSNATKARILITGIIQIGLLAAALWDLRKRPAEQIKGSKKLWLALVFVNYIGPIAYFMFGRKSPQEAAADSDT